jgi:protein-tyrosine phosphatase
MVRLDAMTNDPRRLIWEGCWNTRHLGGYRTEDQTRTHPRGLVRSGNLARLTDTGQAAVIDSGVSCVIDLRSAYELNLEVNPFASLEDDPTVPKYVHAPLIDETQLEAVRRVSSAPSAFAMYEVMLEAFKTNIGGILTAIADAPPGAVVVHCHAGKDRTGLIVALLLRLVGVTAEDIAADYALSDAYLQVQYEEMLSQKTDLQERAALAAQLTSKPETMIATLAFIDERYGGTEAYLRTCGVTTEQLEHLKRRLKEPTLER